MTDFDDENDEDDVEEVADDDAPPKSTEPPPSAAQLALRAQLLEHRDDLALWSVFGDLLLSEDDPRGPLVMLMLERERAPSQKLYASEVAYRTKHLARLLPRELRRSADAVAWRRGFPIGIPISSHGVLAVAISSPSLAFVDSVQIELAAEEWQSFIEALHGVTVPWRRVRISMPHGTEEEALVIAPVLASMPMLEHLQFTFTPYEQPSIDFADAASPRLRHLVFDNASEVTNLETADLPALEELRFLMNLAVGEAVFESELWGRLKQVVTPDVDAVPEGPTLVRHARLHDEDLDYDEVREDAFIAIQQLVDPSLIEEVAATVKGFKSLAIDTGHVVAGGLTAVRMSGQGADSLYPYGLAAQLATRLAPKTPIALFHTSEQTNTARGFALGTHPFRRSLSAGRGAEVLRPLLDQQAGYDPGIDVLDDLVEALECGQTMNLLGPSTRHPVLTDIDPGSMGPLPEVDEDYEEPVPEYARELYTATTEQVVTAVEDLETTEPPALGDAVNELDQELAHDADLAADLPAEGDDEVEDADLRTDGLPDGRDAWVRLLSTWADRERDPDDEYAERFHDPVHAFSEDEKVDFDAVRDESAQCQTCQQERVVIYPCVWCGGSHCANCSIKAESGGVWCNQCVIDLAKARHEDLGPATYNDSVYDTEVAEDHAEARALQRQVDVPDDDEWV